MRQTTCQSCGSPQTRDALQAPEKAGVSTQPLDLSSNFEMEAAAVISEESGAVFRQLPLLPPLYSRSLIPLFIFSQGLPLHQISLKPLPLVMGLALLVLNKLSYN